MTLNVHAPSSVTIAHHFSALARTNTTAPAIRIESAAGAPAPERFANHDEKCRRIRRAHHLVDVARRLDAAARSLALFVAGGAGRFRDHADRHDRERDPRRHRDAGTRRGDSADAESCSRRASPQSPACITMARTTAGAHLAPNCAAMTAAGEDTSSRSMRLNRRFDSKSRRRRARRVLRAPRASHARAPVTPTRPPVRRR